MQFSVPDLYFRHDFNYIRFMYSVKISAAKRVAKLGFNAARGGA